MDFGVAPPLPGYVVNAPAPVRAAFVRRVYGLFFASILVTVAAGAICALPDVMPLVLGAFFPLLIVGFVVGIAMRFTRRTRGLNLALFGLYSAIQGALLGPILTFISRTDPGVPLQAALMTIAVFGTLTVYAMTTERDFNFLGGMLYIALIALIVAGLVMFFVHSALLHTAYCVIGVLIFGGFVLYDTQNVMRRLQPGDEVTGAIELYLDILIMFELLLDLMRRFR